MTRWGEAFNIAMEIQDARLICHTASTLGQVLARAGEYAEARELLGLAVEVGKAAGSQTCREWKTYCNVCRRRSGDGRPYVWGWGYPRGGVEAYNGTAAGGRAAWTPTDEDRYWLEYATKESVDSLARLEDVAKFLIGASATTSGLFVAADKLALGDKATVPGPARLAPFFLWAASILTLLCVLLSHWYPTGKNAPATWKAAVLRARRRKYR